MRLLLLGITLLSYASAFSQQSVQGYKIDTSKVALLRPSNFLTSAVPASLDNDEILLAEKIVGGIFKKISKGVIRSSCPPVDYLALRKRRFFPVKEGDQKFVFLDCFPGDKNEFPSWKKNAVIFFNNRIVQIKINLDKNEHTSYKVNGSCFSRLKVINHRVESTSL